MRRTRTRRTGTGVACAGTLLLTGVVGLTGCGIQESDVVEAGGAATVEVLPQRSDRMLLFFVDENGTVLPVARPIVDPSAPTDGGPAGPGEDGTTGGSGTAGRRVATAKVIAALTHGPTEAERAAGFSTRLPARVWAGQLLDVVVDGAREGAPGTAGTAPEIRIGTGSDVKDLHAAAVRQIVCTAVYAQDPSGLASVVLTGRDGRLPASRCT